MCHGAERKKLMSIGRPPLGFNEHTIDGDTTIIYLQDRSGQIFETLIDTEDLEKIKSLNVHWHAKWDHSSKRYYAKATGRVALGQRKSGFYMHMIVMDFEFNKIEWKVIDHINQNTLDNRKCNLRVSELNENTKHRSRINSNNSSGYRNVSFDGRGNPIVQLQDENGKNLVWRHFKTVAEAGAFAEQKRKELYGEFCGE
jgi:hypothetical protein